MQEGLNPSCLLEGMPGFYLSPSRKELPFQWDKCKCQGNDIPCPVANFRMNATLVTIYAGLEGRIPVDQGQNGCCSMSRTASGEILSEIMDIHRRLARGKSCAASPNLYLGSGSAEVHASKSDILNPYVLPKIGCVYLFCEPSGEEFFTQSVPDLIMAAEQTAPLPHGNFLPKAERIVRVKSRSALRTADTA